MLGWTQEYLAYKAGVSKIALSNFERGQTNPLVGTVQKLENALMEAGIICFGEDEKGGMGVRFR